MGRALITTGWIPLPCNGCTVNHPRNLNLQEDLAWFGWIVTTTQKFQRKKKNHQLRSRVSTEAPFSWKVSVAPLVKECKASYFKHSRSEYKWEKSPNLSWWKWRANSCAIPQQKRSVYRKSQFSHTIVFARFYIAIWWKDLGPLHSESYVASIRISMHTNSLLLQSVHGMDSKLRHSLSGTLVLFPNLNLKKIIN